MRSRNAIGRREVHEQRRTRKRTLSRGREIDIQEGGPPIMDECGRRSAMEMMSDGPSTYTSPFLLAPNSGDYAAVRTLQGYKMTRQGQRPQKGPVVQPRRVLTRLLLEAAGLSADRLTADEMAQPWMRHRLQAEAKGSRSRTV